MTLIRAFGNSEQIILIGDKRLTSDGEVIEEESCKISLLLCSNARLGLGYSGIARAGGFDTHAWLLKTLSNCARPDYEAKEILERFKTIASETFSTHYSLRALPRYKKNLSILFAGYLYHHSPPLAGFAIISNHLNLKDPLTPDEADGFKAQYWDEIRPLDQEPTFIQQIGYTAGVGIEEDKEIRSMLKRKAPTKALLGKVIDNFHKIADSPFSKGLIGKQLMVGIVPRNPSDSFRGEYVSTHIKHITYMPDIVYATKGVNMAVSNISVEAVDPDTTPPLVIPRVSRNAPCPCGSGKKYKRCHGSNR